MQLARSALLWWFWIPCLSWAFAAPAPLQRDQPSPMGTSASARVKASWLPKFLIYTNWPDHGPPGPGPIIIGILGTESPGPDGRTVSDILSEMDGDGHVRVKGKSLKIVRFGPYSSSWQPNCHLLYVTRAEAAHCSQILAQLADQPVLTIGDFPEFIDQGGMISLHTVDGQVRFDINQDAAARAGLHIRTPILRMAARLIRRTED